MLEAQSNEIVGENTLNDHEIEALNRNESSIETIFNNR